MNFLRSITFLLVSTTLGFACVPAYKNQLARYRKQWNVNKPNEYVIETCDTGFLGGGCTRYAVVESKVVAAMSYWNYEENKNWEVIADVSDVEEPVEGMFRSARSDVENLTTLEFDQEWGFVREYYGQYGTEGGGQIVKCFMANTDDLTNCEEI